MTAVQLEHTLCTCTDCAVQEQLGQILGYHLGKKQARMIFAISAFPSVPRLPRLTAPGIQFAEIKLYSVYHLKASAELDFFTVHQGVCRGAAGAAVLLGVAQFVQKAEKMLCALPSLAAVKLFLKYLFP